MPEKSEKKVVVTIPCIATGSKKPDCFRFVIVRIDERGDYFYLSKNPPEDSENVFVLTQSETTYLYDFTVMVEFFEKVREVFGAKRAGELLTTFIIDAKLCQMLQSIFTTSLNLELAP